MTHWSDGSDWQRHINDLPTHNPVGPQREHAGMSAGQLVAWDQITAWEGVQMDGRFRAVLAAHKPRPRWRALIARIWRKR